MIHVCGDLFFFQLRPLNPPRCFFAYRLGANAEPPNELGSTLPLPNALSIEKRKKIKYLDRRVLIIPATSSQKEQLSQLKLVHLTSSKYTVINKTTRWRMKNEEGINELQLVINYYHIYSYMHRNRGRETL